MTFADLKSKRNSNLQFLQKELEKSSAKQGADERLWKPELDSTGNGYAVIRFLPTPDGETVPWAKLYSHAFQGPGGWLIENCPTTTGGQCPICASNNKLWNSGVDADKETVRQRKRKLSYYSNIYVVSDPKHPDNEGKVFLYKFGKKIHDKILSAMNPEFKDEVAINPFDLWEGANFKLKIKTVAGFWNYDSSEFTAPAALSSDDDEMEKIWKQAYSLEAFVADDQFKAYDALEGRLNTVLGAAPATVAVQHEEEYDPVPVAAPAPVGAATEDDDALSYFQQLAND